MEESFAKMQRVGFNRVWHAKIKVIYTSSYKRKEVVEMCDCSRDTNHTETIREWEVQPEQKLHRTKR